MVVISHFTPDHLIAYSTVPLTSNLTASVQKDFAIGSFARFGDPIVTISIHDRPDFHNASHYRMRETLDREGSLNEFLIIDERTANAHAIWYVETTEIGNMNTADAIEYHNPPVSHPGEDFIVWQGRFLTQDFPIQWACFYAGVTDLLDDIESYNDPYDPHNPQTEPFTLGLDFSRKEDAQGFVGDAYLEARFEEVDWSTDIDLRRRFLPAPPVVIKLTTEVAREAGLLSEWSYGDHVPKPGETVSMSAPYDWDSSKWSLNSTSVLKRSWEAPSLTSFVTHASVGASRNRKLVRSGAGGFHSFSSSRSMNALLLKNKPNASRKSSGVA